jgi:hypothetical protein
MNKSFRGKIADGGTERIRLSTNNGLTGYQVVKFQIIDNNPASKAPESVVKVYSKEPLDNTGAPIVPDTTIDFTDPTLLAMAFLKHGSTNTTYDSEIVIFDNMKFNQDIYLTHSDASDNASMNFYLELEQVTLSKDEATVATLKDMRAGPDTNFGS